VTEDGQARTSYAIKATPDFCGVRSRVAGRSVLLLLVACLSGRTAARAEFVISGFGGAAFTQDNELRLKQAGGTDLTFHGVSYEGRDFQSPQYYGVRLSYFLSEHPHWGFGLEFIHAKIYLDRSETVQVSGSRAGAPVNDSERVADTINSFSISHGLNFLTADLIYRWFPAERGASVAGRFQPYAGLGVGALIPHVESDIGGVKAEEYQWRGPGVQAFLGTNFDVTRHWSLFVEYKFSYANLDELSIPGGSISLEPLSHHLVAGISFRF